IELTPRGWTPPGGSTSTLFIQDLTGRRHLRLDYGYNPQTGNVDYHWNQRGTHGNFGIPDHAPAGRKNGSGALSGCQIFPVCRRALLVVGAAIDIYSIVVARRRMRQIVRVAAGWAGAWAGAEGLGALGAAGGTMVEPGLGTAIGGLAFGIVGS